MERTRASRPITGSTPASLVKQNPAPQPAATSYRQPAGPSRRHRAGPPCPQLQGLSDGGGRRSGGDPHSEECAVIDKSRGLAFRSAGRPRRRAQSGVGAAAAAVDPQGLRSLSPKREWTQSSPVAGTRAGTTVCRIVQLHMQSGSATPAPAPRLPSLEAPSAAIAMSPTGSRDTTRLEGESDRPDGGRQRALRTSPMSICAPPALLQRAPGEHVRAQTAASIEFSPYHIQQPVVRAPAGPKAPTDSWHQVPMADLLGAPALSGVGAGWCVPRDLAPGAARVRRGDRDRLVVHVGGRRDDEGTVRRPEDGPKPH
jgi:hypothetical protein